MNSILIIYTEKLVEVITINTKKVENLEKGKRVTFTGMQEFQRDKRIILQRQIALKDKEYV